MDQVVVVDDSSLQQDLINDTLDQMDEFEVIATADNGEEAIEVTRDLEPDIVTMDIMMPKMGGVEATEYISNKLTCDPDIVAVTSSRQNDILNQIEDAGAKGYIQKPFGIHELQSELKKYSGY